MEAPDDNTVFHCQLTDSVSCDHRRRVTVGTAVLETPFNGDVFAAVDADAGPRCIVDFPERQTVNDHIIDIFKGNGGDDLTESVNENSSGFGCSESQRGVFVSAGTESQRFVVHTGLYCYGIPRYCLIQGVSNGLERLGLAARSRIGTVGSNEKFSSSRGLNSSCKASSILPWHSRKGVREAMWK